MPARPASSCSGRSGRSWPARRSSPGTPASEPPETFANRKVAIFGDFTYPLGFGYALSREVGLEVVACGTYLTHLESDFLFHAHTFTEGGFVEEDPEGVAARIEASGPDLVIGTHLEVG